MLVLLLISHKMIKHSMLHTYMMYLKFGFGRATQDAKIEIRRGGSFKRASTKPCPFV